MPLSTDKDIIIQVSASTAAAVDTIETKSNAAIYFSLIGILCAILMSILFFMAIILVSMEEIFTTKDYKWTVGLELCIFLNFAFITSVLWHILRTFKNIQNKQSTESTCDTSLSYLVQLLAIVIIFAMFMIIAYNTTLYDRDDMFFSG